MSQNHIEAYISIGGTHLVCDYILNSSPSREDPSSSIIPHSALHIVLNRLFFSSSAGCSKSNFTSLCHPTTSVSSFFESILSLGQSYVSIPVWGDERYGTAEPCRGLRCVPSCFSGVKVLTQCFHLVLERFFSRAERRKLFLSWAGSASMWIKVRGGYIPLSSSRANKTKSICTDTGRQCNMGQLHFRT